MYDKSGNFDGILIRWELEKMREFFGKALKFTLPFDDWNFSGPLNLTIRKKNFHNNEVIKTMADAFCDFKQTEMLKDGDLVAYMKLFVKYGKGISEHKTKRRTRKKRVGMAINKYKKLARKRKPSLKGRKEEKRPHKGALAFGSIIRKTFMGRKS